MDFCIFLVFSRSLQIWSHALIHVRLTELVQKHKDLVENKKNNYKTTQQKNKAWEALSEQLNSPPGAMEPS